MTQLNQTDSVALDRIQWACIRVCLGSTKTTHTGSLEVLAGLCPLSIRRESAAIRFVNRRSHLTNWNQRFVQPILETGSTNSYIRKAINELNNFIPLQNTLDNIPCFLFPLDVGKFDLSIDLCMETKLAQPHETSAAEIFLTVMEEKYDEWTTLATDGSRDISGVGFSVVNNSNIDYARIKLNPASSVYMAELLAIRKAVQIIDEQPVGKFVIISDSMSSLKSLQCSKPLSKNPLAWYEIKKISKSITYKGSELVFMWVPSHRGIPLNELADQEAKKACTEGIGNDYIITSNDVSFPYRLHSKQLWQYRWNSGSKGRFCHSIMKEVSLQPWFFKTELSRRQIVILSKLISNHSRLPAHLHRNRIIESANCSCGATNANPDHYLFSCPNFGQMRWPIWKILLEKRIAPDLQLMLKTKNLNMFRNIADFFIDCNIDM